MGDAPRKHRLLFELGRGGMGTVYLAVAEGPAGFSKLKVVKHLNPRLAAEPQFLEMFLDEARLTALLNHPNIVQTNEVGFDGQDYFIEMEYLDGQPYDAIIRRGTGRVTVPVHLWILAQVLAGLHHAHELRSRDDKPLGLVHRDVSPHNVFVTYEGSVKLLDFGIARVLGSQAHTATGVLKGKARYMAPEHAMKRVVDRRADVFAVGIMLWEALSGHRMWEGLDDYGIFRKLETGDFARAGALPPEVPAALQTICERALTPAPDERYSTAAAFAEALHDHLETTGAHAGPRQTSKLVSELFADRRAAVDQEIKQRLAHAPDVASVSVPQLGLSSAYQRTATGETRSESGVSGGRTSAESPAALDVQHHDEREVSRTRSGVEGRKSATESNVGRGSLGWWALAAGLGVAILGGVVIVERVVHSTASTRTQSASTGQPSCSRNADCLSAAVPSVCRRPAGTCVALASPSCRVVAEPGDVENDETIWFGSMFPTSAPDAELVGKPYERGMLVAREDFVKMTQGLPQPDGLGKARPLGIVACDDTENAEVAAQHLVDVGVPAVIGFAQSAEVINLATTVFLPHHVLVVAAMDGSPLIAKIPAVAGDPRMVIRTTAELYAMSAPMAALVPQELEPYVRAKGWAAPDEPLRVALVRLDTLTQVSLGSDIVGALRFNDLPALENRRNFEDIVVRATDDAARNDEIVDRLARLAPHVILFTGPDDFARAFFEPLEDRWPRTLRHRPFYVRDSDVDGPAVREWIHRDPDVRTRLYGMYGPLQSAANLRFTTRYNEGMPRPVPYTLTPSPSFDAFYVLAYGAFAVGRAPITGPSLARAIGQLHPPGEPVDVGAARIFDVIAQLRQGRRVDLNGAATYLNFDPQTGDVVSDAILHCMRGAGDSLDSDELPVVYDAASGKWSGAIGCPR